MADRNISIRLSLRDGEVVRRALLQLGEDGQSALARIERQSQPASRGLLAINAASAQVRGQMVAFGQPLGAVGAGLQAIGPAGIAAAASIGALVLGLGQAIDATKRALEEFDALDDAAQRVGVGVEALQEFRYAFEQNNVAAGELDKALTQLGRKIGEVAAGRGKEAKDAFEALGISVLKADGTLKSVEELLPELADGFKNTTDQNTRLAASMQLFERGGANMVLLLQQGREALERLRAEAREVGAVMDEHIVKRAADTNDKLTVLNRIVQTQLNGAFVDLAPLVVEAAQAFATLARWVGDVVDGFREIEARSTRGLERRLEELTQSIASRRAALPGARGLSAAGIGNALKKEEDEAARIGAELERRRAAAESRAHSGSGAPGVPSAVRDRIDELREEGEGLVRIILAYEESEAAVRRTTEAVAAETEVRRLKIDGHRAEVAEIERLILRNKELAATLGFKAREADLNAENQALERLNEVVRDGADAVRDVTTENRMNEEIRRLGIDAASREAEQIRRLIDANEALRHSIDVQRRAREVMARFDGRAQLEEDLRALEEMRQTGILSEEAYTRAVQDANRRRLEVSREGADGIKRALIDYYDEASNAALNFEAVTTGALLSIEDAFVSMATTGKFEFRSLVDAILADIARLVVRQTVTAPIAGFLSGLGGSIFGSLFGGGFAASAATITVHDGGIAGEATTRRMVDPAVFIGARRLHGGGLAADEVPAILLKRERVLTEAQQENTARTIAGLAGLASRDREISVVHNVYNSSSATRARAQSSWGRGGQLQIDVFVDEIEGRMARNIGRGEGLAPTLEQKYGLNPAAGARR